MRWLAISVLVLGVALAGAGCTDSKKKMREAQKRLDAERKANQEAEEAKRKAAAPKVEQAQLEPFWGDTGYVRVATGRPCPEGLGALFPNPGATSDADTAAKLRDSTFVTVLSHGSGVELRQYNPKKKTLTVEVDGMVECFDSSGLLTVAWGAPAKPYRPSEDAEEDVSPQAVWRARPLRLPLTFPNAAEAKRFSQKEGLGVDARLVYRLGKVDVDSKVKKPPPSPSAEPGTVPTEGIDWGAGRLVHVDLLGVRLAVDHEKTALIEQRKQGASSARSQ